MNQFKKFRKVLQLGAMTSALSMLFFGCTSPDPESVYNDQVDEFDVAPLDTAPPEGCLNQAIDFSGTYLFAFATSVDFEKPILFEATVVTAADLASFDITLQPLSTDLLFGDAEEPNPDPRAPVGVVRTDTGQMNADGTWEIVMTDWIIPALGNPVTGGELVATVTLSGNACNAEHFCGMGDGSVIGVPLTGSTFGAVLLEEGEDIVTTQIQSSCIDYSGEEPGDTGVSDADTSVEDTGTDIEDPDIGADTDPEPVLEDQCLNEADMEIVNSGADLSGLAKDCGMGCFSADDQRLCTTTCMQEGDDQGTEDPEDDIIGVPLTDGCAACYSDAVSCAIDNCALPCATDPDSEECSTCRTEAGCDDNFVTCFGEVPPIDQCNNLSDHELVQAPEPDISGIAGTCGMSCFSDDDSLECTNICLAEDETLTDVSEGCRGCYSATVVCTIDNCIPACMDSSSEACVTCQIESGCIADFVVCYGEAPIALCNESDLATMNDDTFVDPDFSTCIADCDAEEDYDACIDTCIATTAEESELTFICTSCYMTQELCDSETCADDFAACIAAQ